VGRWIWRRIKERENFPWESWNPCMSAIAAVFERLVVGQIARDSKDDGGRIQPRHCGNESRLRSPPSISHHPAINTDCSYFLLTAAQVMT
jgi:hypothetical protein